MADKHNALDVLDALLPFVEAHGLPWATLILKNASERRLKASAKVKSTLPSDVKFNKALRALSGDSLTSLVNKVKG